MNIKFTKHSLEQIQRRNISKTLIKKSLKLSKFSYSINYQEITKITNKISANKILIIICVFTPNECRIITAYFTSKIKKYLTD